MQGRRIARVSTIRAITAVVLIPIKNCGSQQLRWRSLSRNRTGQIRIYRTRLCRYAERTQRGRPVIYLLAAAYLPTSI